MLTPLLLLLLAGQQAEPAPAPVKEKKICRVQETTGSRLSSRRICKTQAEWDAVALVRAGSERLGGKGGGGRRDMAQAGGPDGAAAEAALEAIAAALAAA